MYWSQPSLTILITSTISNSLTTSTWIVHTPLPLKLSTPFSSILLLSYHRTQKLLIGPVFLLCTLPTLIFFFFFAIPHFPLRTINHHQFYPQCLFYSPDLLKLRPSLVFKHSSCVRHCGRCWLLLKVYSSLSFRKAILILSRAHNRSAKGKS